MCLETIHFYQYFLSPLKPRCCRFYPSCSEYAKWQFQKKNFFIAFMASFWRILRCNPYSQGGFDYPKIRLRICKFIPYTPDMNIIFFYVPYTKKDFYIIKKVFKGKS